MEYFEVVGSGISSVSEERVSVQNKVLELCSVQNP